MKLFKKKSFNTSIVCLVMILAAGTSRAQPLNLIPYPASVKVLKGRCILKNTPLRINDPQLSHLLHYFNQETGLSKKNPTRRMQLITMKIVRSSLTYGGYTLKTLQNQLTIEAGDTTGLFNGLVTLSQLYRTSKVFNGRLILPALIIHDQPRFAWRGILLDESRHFFGKYAVKELLDWMAFYKLNRFHWHLTDAQGWRLDIKQYPLLASVGGRGNITDSLAGTKYYSQQDIQEIVAYAKERFITIIPEIDMPGHATAANRAYPEYSGGSTPGYNDFTFNPGKDGTYLYLSTILRELKFLFPSGMIHLGGDEVSLGIAAREKNKDVSRLMAAHHLTDLVQVEHYFLNRVADSVIKSGENVVCWDEAVTAGLPVKETTIDWWRQDKPESLNEAVHKGYKVVLCPRLPLYFDFVQDSTHQSGRKWDKRYNSYLDVYHFPENSMADSILGTPNILGLQANLWTETVASTKRLQYLVFPRIAGLAEAGWTEPGNKNDSIFNKRLKAHLLLYDSKQIYYYDPFKPQLHPEPIDVATEKDNQ
jgi:hexosaminidase